MRVLTSSTIVALALMFVSCASRQAFSARLTKREAVRIAITTAQKAGDRLDAYEAPRVDFDPTKKQWSVFFEHKPPGFPGGYISILVDDKSGVGTHLPSD
jgi:hypothetical protein